jgi:protein phosphatase
MDRVAIVSDIHGNLTAWQAVLADIAELGVTATYCLGDLAGKGPRGAEVVDACRQHCSGVVMGNWDEGLSQQPAEAYFRWYRDQLGDERLTYLAGLPKCVDLLLSGRRVRLFHASSDSLYHRIFPSSSAEEHAAMFDNTEFTGWGHPEPTVVGYGDIHDCYLLPLEQGTLFNVGSVGNPLDGTDAAYVLLEGRLGDTAPGAWGLQFRRVPYDIEGEIAVARRSGLPDFVPYAIELRTGIYRGHHAAAGLSLDS